MNLNSGKHGLSLLRSSGDSIRRFDENAWIDVLSMLGRRPSGTSARSLRSDRAGRSLGRYVATELWLELGLYVATELWLELSRYIATELDERSVAT
ncbi:hypothetical protein F2Q69_00022251 [Brassica cretica]|uniref:Uncharacterized protein n=1 Tax=Brassica cretica TaxID=69181 RepID=A0A8S9Q963_BRACR|nr:hypothetical protein F2Q69_00022251 [Brassica cretica]